MKNDVKIIQKIFSIKNADEKHKLIHIAGIKIRVKRNRKAKAPQIQTSTFCYNKSKTIEKNPYCTGCSACKNICPQGAITMQENKEGFLTPILNKSLCTNCGLCNAICPIINYKKQKKIAPPKTFAIQCCDETRKNSTSGGVFKTIAESILKDGGYVCGVKYSKDFYSVEHTIISDINDLPQLLISKYVQSDLTNIFSTIKKLLDEQKTVLFSGTPCQVAGLKAYLRKDYKNLFLLDLICCGIPSRKVYRKYLDEVKYDKNEQIKNVIFRLKDNGWYSRAIKIITDKHEYRIPNNECIYEQAHFRGLNTNKICQICPYDVLEREGDLTIGDFWGIAKYDKNLDDNNGTSVVFLNTQKGEFLLNKIRDKLKLLKETPFEWVLPCNENLIKPIKHLNRKQFFYNLDKMSIQENYSKCMRDTADCIIFNNALTDVNYGSMLTAYALQEVLAQQGIFSKNINHARVPLRSSENNFSRKFIREYINLTQEVNSEPDFINLNNKTDVFIVGSDQMWRPKYFQNKLDKVLLNFAEKNKKRFSISASFGLDYFEGTDFEKALFKDSLKRFNAISVREKNGIEICRKEFDCSAQHLLDPVLVLTKEHWDNLIEHSDIDCSNELVYYGWGFSEKFKNDINILAQNIGCTARDITREKLDVEDWLKAIKTSKFFVSNSYHGICFAIIFEKPFLCICNLGQDRLVSLFETLNIRGNVVNSDKDILSANTSDNIDYSHLDDILNKGQQKFIEFLNQIKNAKAN